MNRKSKIYSQETVGILLGSLRVIVSVWVCVGVCVCLSGLRIIVCMYGWRIVYVKVQTQRVVLTGYKFVGVSYFCYIISFQYV